MCIHIHIQCTCMWCMVQAAAVFVTDIIVTDIGNIALIPVHVRRNIHVHVHVCGQSKSTDCDAPCSVYMSIDVYSIRQKNFPCPFCFYWTVCLKNRKTNGCRTGLERRTNGSRTGGVRSVLSAAGHAPFLLEWTLTWLPSTWLATHTGNQAP